MLVPKNYLYYDLWRELDKVEATLYLVMAPQQIKGSYFQMSYEDLIRATKLSETCKGRNNRTCRKRIHPYTAHQKKECLSGPGILEAERRQDLLRR